VLGGLLFVGLPLNTGTTYWFESWYNLGSVCLGVKVEWDSPVSDFWDGMGWDGMTLFLFG
jgi:hypothetical protein